MGNRSDALVAAAKIVLDIEQMARNFLDRAVATVCRIECEPNAINVIPGAVRFTIDFRSADENVLATGHAQIEQMILKERGTLLQTEDQLPVKMDAALCDRLVHAAGRPIPLTTSGALHDAAIIAPLLPTAMLFVASKDGISHHPDEFSRIDDIAAAAELLFRAVSDAGHAKISLLELNQCGRSAFVGVCGPLFEHSPWIAQHTWPARPFENLHALHQALCQTMYGASKEEQIALICAHPDLVGRMADLTNDSKSEQAAAGLTELNAEDAAAFKRYNAAYRAKFGFPFVICARENKKDAILKAFPIRLENTPEQEIATALGEISKIALLRLKDRVYETV